MALPVNFKDDVLASSMDGKRRYNMITNSDGTVSFEDVTTYSQEGSNFGSAQINNTNGAINTINNNVLDTIEEISANTSGGKFAGALALKNVNNSFGGMKFGIDSDGNYGYIKAGADSVTPFSKDIKYLSWIAVNNNSLIQGANNWDLSNDTKSGYTWVEPSHRRVAYNKNDYWWQYACFPERVSGQEKPGTGIQILKDGTYTILIVSNGSVLYSCINTKLSAGFEYKLTTDESGSRFLLAIAH